MRTIYLFIFICILPSLAFAQQDDDQDDDDNIYKSGRFRFTFQEHLLVNPPQTFNYVNIDATQSGEEILVNLSNLSPSIRNEIVGIFFNQSLYRTFNLPSSGRVFIGISSLGENVNHLEIIGDNARVLYTITGEGIDGRTMIASVPEDLRKTTDVTISRMFLFDYHLNPKGKYGRFYLKLGYAQGQVVDTRSIVENKQLLMGGLGYEFDLAKLSESTAITTELVALYGNNLLFDDGLYKITALYNFQVNLALHIKKAGLQLGLGFAQNRSKLENTGSPLHNSFSFIAKFNPVSFFKNMF